MNKYFQKTKNSEERKSVVNVSVNVDERRQRVESSELAPRELPGVAGTLPL